MTNVLSLRAVSRNGRLFTGAPAAAAFPRATTGQDLGPNDFVVALLPDTRMRYLSKVYNEEWMRERGYVDTARHYGRGSRSTPNAPIGKY